MVAPSISDPVLVTRRIRSPWQPGGTIWTVVVAAVGFEAVTVHPPLMTGNPPGRYRTDPATPSIVTDACRDGPCRACGNALSVGICIGRRQAGALRGPIRPVSNALTSVNSSRCPAEPPHTRKVAGSKPAGSTTKTAVKASRLSHGSVPDRRHTMPNVTIWKRWGVALRVGRRRLLIIHVVVKPRLRYGMRFCCIN
jgi:hypothetical protein